MVEGGHHPRNRPPTSVDFYHYPVTVWAYSAPQPNTEVPRTHKGIWPLGDVEEILKRIIFKLIIQSSSLGTVKLLLGNATEAH